MWYKKKVKGYIDAVSIDNENKNFFLSKYLVNKKYTTRCEQWQMQKKTRDTTKN